MFKSSIIQSVKSLFIKEETFSCIVWDTKMMNYLNLTKKQIDNIRTSREYEGWSVTINEE